MEFIIAGSVVAAVVVALFVYLVVRIKRNHDGNSENHVYAGEQPTQLPVIFTHLHKATKNAVTTAPTNITSGEADVAAATKAAIAYFPPRTTRDALEAEVKEMRARSRAGKPFMKLPTTATTDVGNGRKYIEVVQLRKQTHKNRKQARRRQN
jgi:hypothetical protein